MPEVSLSENLPVSVDGAWAVVSDLSAYGEWLTLLEGWRGDVPALASGAEISAVIKAKGLRNRVTIVVRDFDPPNAVTLVGEGVGGTAVTLAFRLSGNGDSSRLEFDVDFRHPALIGPMGSIAGRTIKGDLKTSLARFKALASI